MSSMWAKVKRAVVGQREVEVVVSGPAASPHGPLSGEPADFFPYAVGSAWEYLIDVSADPLYFRQILRPAGNGYMSVNVRGRFAAALHRRAGQQFRLNMSILQRAQVPGRLQNAGGVELTIASDELGIYERTRRVFWAVTTQGRFDVLEVLIHPPEPGMGMGHFSFGDGESVRPLFFADQPGKAIGLGQETTDLLSFEGLDSTRSPQWDGPVLHFVRQVKPAEEKGELSSGFEEHIWYGYRVGMVELTQFAQGRETMHWVLQNFRPGNR
jgi:hypothetical protein